MEESTSSGGWYQALPADPGLYVGWILVAGQGQRTDLVVAAAYGADRDEARQNAQAELDWALEQGYEALAESEAAWWRRYWRQSPWITVPDATLQEAYTWAWPSWPASPRPARPPPPCRAPGWRSTACPLAV